MFLMRLDSASSSGPSHGQCGAVKCRLIRNGSFDLSYSSTVCTARSPIRFVMYPCRRANGRVRVALREHQSLDRQAVDVRRRIITLAVAAHVGIAEVIRHDEDDVRFDSLRPTRTAEAEPGQRQRARGTRLDKSTTRNYAALRH